MSFVADLSEKGDFVAFVSQYFSVKSITIAMGNRTWLFLLLLWLCGAVRLSDALLATCLSVGLTLTACLPTSLPLKATIALICECFLYFNSN